MPENNGNGFKLKTVEDIAKLNAAIEILTERISTKIDGLQKDVRTLSEEVKNIKQPCSVLERHLDNHRKSSIAEWIKKKPIQAAIIVLLILSQLSVNVDGLIDLVSKLIK